MIKFVCLLFAIENVLLFAIFILRKIRYRKKRKEYKTPKLSELHGKEFGNYIDYLRKDL